MWECEFSYSAREMFSGDSVALMCKSRVLFCNGVVVDALFRHAHILNHQGRRRSVA